MQPDEGKKSLGEEEVWAAQFGAAFHPERVCAILTAAMYHEQRELYFEGTPAHRSATSSEASLQLCPRSRMSPQSESFIRLRCELRGPLLLKTESLDVMPSDTIWIVKWRAELLFEHPTANFTVESAARTMQHGEKVCDLWLESGALLLLLQYRGVKD
jgi:hypothetical protein